jgi:hypothetical protein
MTRVLLARRARAQSMLQVCSCRHPTDGHIAVAVVAVEVGAPIVMLVDGVMNPSALERLVERCAALVTVHGANPKVEDRAVLRVGVGRVRLGRLTAPFISSPRADCSRRGVCFFGHGGAPACEKLGQRVGVANAPDCLLRSMVTLRAGCQRKPLIVKGRGTPVAPAILSMT